MKKLLVLTFICSVICFSVSAYNPEHYERLWKYHKGERSNKDFRGVDLSGAVICFDLPGIDLTGANLKDAYFCNSNLTGVTFTSPSNSIFGETRLERTDFSNTKLEKSDFSGACLEGAKFTGARLKGAKFTGVYTDVKVNNSHIEGSDFSNVKGLPTRYNYSIFNQTRLGGPDFSGARMDGADFSRARLPRAKFIGASGNYVKFNNSHIEGSDFSNSDLPYVDFSEAFAKEATFNDGNFRFGNFSKADLTRSNLHRAHLEDTNCREAGLREANFLSARCERADFSEVQLDNTSFYNVNFVSAKLHRVKVTRNVNLDYANFSSVEFRGSDFKGFIFPESCGLISANFAWCNLCESVLYSKDLIGVRFYMATLSDAKIRNCKLGNTSFAFAKLDNFDLRDTKSVPYLTNSFMGARGKKIKIWKGWKNELRIVDIDPDSISFEEL